MPPTATPTTMPESTAAPVPAAAEPDYRPYHLTIERYERMIAAGVFNAKDRVFLWHGRLVEKMTKGSRHSLALLALTKLLDRFMPAGWHARPEQPMAVGDDTMPEPDVTVARGSLYDYPDRQPSAREVALVVEVADSSVAEDSGTVLKTFARAAVPVYWVVNIPNRRIEVYSDPTGPADAPTYRGLQAYGADEVVPVVLDGVEVGRIAVRDVLP